MKKFMLAVLFIGIFMLTAGMSPKPNCFDGYWNTNPPRCAPVGAHATLEEQVAYTKCSFAWMQSCCDKSKPGSTFTVANGTRSCV